MPYFRDLPQPGYQAPGAPTARAQVPVPVPLRRSSRLWFLERPYSNLVPLLDSNLFERQGVVSTPDGCSRSELPPSRQLFPVGRALAEGATPAGPATHRRVARVAGRHRSDVEPDQGEIFQARPTTYYWTTYQSEW